MNEKTLIIGVGRQGERILELLLERNFNNLFIFDVNPATTSRLANKYKARVQVVSKNPFEICENDRISFLRDFDYLIDALPSMYSYQILKDAVRSGIKVVSVSFLEEDFMKLDDEAKKSGSILVPDCGVAPGFSHLMAGYSVKELDETQKVEMKLGAIPKNPESPFFHSFSWSVADLIEEYVRPAKVRVNGNIETVDPFTTIKDENILGLRLESFITDGARSFLTSYPEVKDVSERTLRHKGHLGFMKTFKDSGFFETEPVCFENQEILPYKFLANVFEKTFIKNSPFDLFVMEIIVHGKKNNQNETHVHQYLIDYDNKHGVFALVNAVAITAVQTLCLIRDGVITEPGVYPLELLASETVFESIAGAHRNLGARIIQTILPAHVGR